ncbi:biotin--[acetyl-CoA-carboxylase] ligase [Piscinibacter sp.]|uniref:biotin--[acetyl-CoA-carboxylase] ligase n=1 Tax=Piscinibacter sp. TaxID=1903157 RepID=UPI002F42E701
MPLRLEALPRHHARAEAVNPIPAPPQTPLHWGAEALWAQLEPRLPGLSVEVVERIASTNSALLERARNVGEVREEGSIAQVRRSVESGAFGRRSADMQPCLLVAEHQTHGRGRHGRSWQAAPGASLTFSLALPLAPSDWSGLSLAVGVALADALDPSRDGATARIGVKWPNDLWMQDSDGGGRKLGGILIETVSAGARRLAVIGVGLNVLPLTTPDASSGFACLQELDAQASAPQVLAQVAAPLLDALLQFERDGFAPFALRFAARDLLRERHVRTTQRDAAEGVAIGVSASGALLVRTADGVRAVTSGEVSVRLDPSAPC